MLTDAYESLCKGCLVCEVHYSACKSALPPIPSHQPCQLNQPISVKCTSYATVSKYKVLNSLFGRYNPILYTVDGVSGIFSTIKGSTPVSGYIKKQCSTGKDAEDASLTTLGVSILQLDLSVDLQQL